MSAIYDEPGRYDRSPLTSDSGSQVILGRGLG